MGKSIAFALCHSQGFLCDESVASGAEQELALERYAISHSCSCRVAFVAKETLAPVAVSRYGKSEAYFIF